LFLLKAERLLETFVETQHFSITCYKAADWIHVGQTKGRGKLEVHQTFSLPFKDIWLYPPNTLSNKPCVILDSLAITELAEYSRAQEVKPLHFVQEVGKKGRGKVIEGRNLVIWQELLSLVTENSLAGAPGVTAR